MAKLGWLDEHSKKVTQWDRVHFGLLSSSKLMGKGGGRSDSEIDIVRQKTM